MYLICWNILLRIPIILECQLLLKNQGILYFFVMYIYLIYWLILKFCKLTRLWNLNWLYILYSSVSLRLSADSNRTLAFINFILVTNSILRTQNRHKFSAIFFEDIAIIHTNLLIAIYWKITCLIELAYRIRDRRLPV